MKKSELVRSCSVSPEHLARVALRSRSEEAAAVRLRLELKQRCEHISFSPAVFECFEAGHRRVGLVCSVKARLVLEVKHVVAQGCGGP